MSKNNENFGQKRQLAGALAATLGLVAIACSGDDDDDGAMSPGGSSPGTAGKTGGQPAAGKGGMASGGKATGGTTSGGKASGGGAVAGTAMGGAGGAPEPSEDLDVEPLNALLTAEYNAITAYTAGAGLIDGAPESDPLYGLRDVVLEIAVDIQSHHQLHAAALVEAIEALGGTAVEEAAVAKSFKAPKPLTDNPSITNVLKFACSAERAAAVAYNQVLAGLQDAKHRFIAASIEGDETQHFIVLAALVLGLADPGPMLDVDTAQDVVPRAFVAQVGEVGGLESAPADYFP